MMSFVYSSSFVIVYDVNKVFPISLTKVKKLHFDYSQKYLL